MKLLKTENKTLKNAYVLILVVRTKIYKHVLNKRDNKSQHNEVCVFTVLHGFLFDIYWRFVTYIKRDTCKLCVCLIYLSYL